MSLNEFEDKLNKCVKISGICEVRLYNIGTLLDNIHAEIKITDPYRSDCNEMLTEYVGDLIDGSDLSSMKTLNAVANRIIKRIK